MKDLMDVNQLKSKIFLVFILLSSKANAGDLLSETRFISGLSLGYSTFSFPEKIDQDISFSSAIFTLAAAHNNWQASFVSGITLDDANVSEEEDIGLASRQDFDLTLGYSLTPNWAIFGGYKSGKTEMEFTSRESLDEGTPITQQESYLQKGPYVGVSYSFHFEKAGSLNISLAYADLNATNNFKANTDVEEEEEDDDIEFDDLTGQVKGDMRGFSFSVAWTMPLSSRLLFQSKFKINDYKQDLKVDGVEFNDINESFTYLHVGLAYVF